MAILPGILPPSRETWELATWGFSLFPIFTAIQWMTDWYPSGKTSINSKLNLPGKWGWAIMEIPGPIVLLYIMTTLPAEVGITHPLPWGNWTMAGMYCTHYAYRALLFPYLAPSMSPMHVLPFLFAIAFNTINGLCLGGWLAGHGPTTVFDWSGGVYRMQIAMVLWGWSLLANFFHDDDLREIRRAAARMQNEKAEKEGKKPDAEGVESVYMIPKNGLFHFVLHAHYFCEWCEWAAFWAVGGWGCTPARNFFVNEVATMLPRALAGKRWYIAKFGKEKVGNRKAVIPGII